MNASIEVKRGRHVIGIELYRSDYAAGLGESYTIRLDGDRVHWTQDRADAKRAFLTLVGFFTQAPANAKLATL